MHVWGCRADRVMSGVSIWRGVEQVPTCVEVIEQVCDEIAVVLDDQNSHGLAPWPQRGLASAQERTPDVGIAWTSAALNTAPTRALPLSDTRAGSLPRNRATAPGRTSDRLDRSIPACPSCAGADPQSRHRPARPRPAPGQQIGQAPRRERGWNAG